MKKQEKINPEHKMMKPPPDCRPFETNLTTLWFEGKIVCSVLKPNAAITRDSLSVIFEYVAAHSGGEKVCCLSDITHCSAPSREGRDYGASEGLKHIKALALITNSFMARTIADIFLLVQKPGYPVKLFTEETAARQWLASYIAEE